MNDKLFTIAGTSKVNGVATLRFATGNVKVREGVLRRAGFSDIQLFELPQPMTRQDAAAWLAAKGIEAVVPVKGGNGKPLELTDEQRADADAAAKKAAFVTRMQAARAAKADARRAAMDHNFMADLTGEEKVPVPDAEPEDEVDTVTDTAAVDVTALLEEVPEGTVNAEREIAGK